MSQKSFIGYLPRNSLGWLMALGVVSLVIFSTQLYRLNQEITREMAIREAGLVLNNLSQFRTVYSSEVIEQLENSSVNVTHRYLVEDNAIPLPSTLTMVLSDRIAESGFNMQTRLYSDYPFPWREESGGAKDPFEKQALVVLKQDPEQPYYQFTTINGIKYLRYAKADLMRPACIKCHNTHPDSPKTNWEVGDLRGVLTLTMPLEKQQKTVSKNISQIFFLVLGAFAAFIILVFAIRTWGKEVSKHHQDK